MCSALMRLLAVAFLLLISKAARADEVAPAEPTQVTFAMMAGAGTALAAFAAGSTVVATADSHRGKNAGVFISQAGFIAAPLLSHAIVGEYSRGLYFSLAPIASTFVLAALLDVRPRTTTEGSLGFQYEFAIPIAVSIFSTVIGVVDTSLAGQRASRKPAVAPLAIDRGFGLAVRGAL
ncbi:MAG TPA: hypothetical protein VJT73_02520 [Polyangiaceae bacterium]|nr:hypothetical protein [Polyangiaceae bacterium]